METFRPGERPGPGTYECAECGWRITITDDRQELPWSGCYCIDHGREDEVRFRRVADA
jgi:hypothetical protein